MRDASRGDGHEHDRALAGALTYVRGAYRRQIWERLAEKPSLLAELEKEGRLVRSGHLWFMIDNPIKLRAGDRKWLGHVAELLIAETNQRSPVDIRLARDAYNICVHLERWDEAVEVLDRLSATKWDPAGWFVRALRDWVEERGGAEDPRWTRLRNETLPVLLTALLVHLPELGKEVLKDPRFLWRRLEFPHAHWASYGYEEISSFTNSPADLVTGYRNSVEFYKLNLDFQCTLTWPHPTTVRNIVLRKIADRMVELAEEIDAAAAPEKWATSLGYECLDNASLIYRFIGGEAYAREIHGRARAAQAGIQGVSAERGRFLSNILVFELDLENPDIEWAESLFTLSCMNFAEAGDFDGILKNLGLLARKGLLDWGSCREEATYLDENPGLHVTGPLRPGWRVR